MVGTYDQNKSGDTRIIVSVPNTGTRFLRERLEVKDFVHTIKEWDSLVKALQGRTIITPLRSPKANWESWTRRTHKNSQFDVAQFCQAWFQLHALDQIFDIDYICIEKQTDSRITDWEKVGNEDYGPYKNHHGEIDLRPIYNLPLVKRFYGKYD